MHFDFLNFTHDTFAAQCSCMDEFATTALLATHLQDTSVFAYGFAELLAFVDGERQGLFQIDILAGLASSNSNDGMLMIGRRNNNRVDILASQKVLIILINIDFHLLFALLLVVVLNTAHEAVTLYVIHVTACQYAHVVKGHKCAQQIHGLLPEANETKVHFSISRLLRSRSYIWQIRISF